MHAESGGRRRGLRAAGTKIDRAGTARRGAGFRKPEWLDSAVGLAGLVLSVGSVLALVSDSGVGLYAAVYGALGLGVAIVLLAVFFRPRHSLRELREHERKAVIEDVINRGAEMIILNPSPQRFDIRPYVNRAVAENIPVHVVGGAPLVEHLFDALGEPLEKSFVNFVRLTDSVSHELIICVLAPDNVALSACIFLDHRVFLFQINDPVTAPMIANLIKREGEAGGYVSLRNVAHARSFLSAVTDEQRRFLENFSSLRQGHISFYGTQVQQVQSGLMQTGRYRRVDTLDITTSPKVLLQRKRYIEVNRSFIAGGGVIRRVFMVTEADMENPEFLADLRTLARLQRELGVDAGLIYIDDLSERLRRDFILYDDAVVLVEDRQANLDYSLGRSTAYFAADVVQRYREHFNQVWNGSLRGVTPREMFARVCPP